MVRKHPYVVVFYAHPAASVPNHCCMAGPFRADMLRLRFPLVSLLADQLRNIAGALGAEVLLHCNTAEIADRLAVMRITALPHGKAAPGGTRMAFRPVR
ncbi:hypothetical protein [Novosphingobium sp. Leaf2]|uniref:hypothetical protein n=1 Tax=Novosphingobium sp. Leaf2 TaxID=1735670 RepID=UPI0012E0CBAA|nr:hypothetical protein [Novosphingobium sp. Leaf2]